MRLTPNFTLAELTVTNSGIDNTPSARDIERLRALALKILQPLRDHLNAPVIVNSAFRTERVNRAVGGSATSQHVTGEAADVWTPSQDSRELAETIVRLKLPFDQLIVYPNSTRVHVSYGPRHRRQVLTAVQGRGGTTYKPGMP